MAFSKVDEKYVSFADGGTANGSTGHDVVGVNGTTAATGDVDVLVVGSDTTVTTPSGFTLVQTFVNNQGGYHFERICAGGESSTIRVKTTGDFNTTALYQRWRGASTRDVAVNSHVDSLGALVSNPINSGTLAAATELVIVASVMTDSVSAAPTLDTWSTGYTPGDGASSIGTGATCSAGFISHKTPAGTAAETPQVSWLPDNMRNRYTFLVSYTLASGTSVTINDSSGGLALGGTADGLSITSTKQDGSGGLALGGTADLLSISSTKLDSSGGLSLGGTADANSRAITDGSGGLSLGGTADTTSSTIADSSGGLALGGSNELPTIGTTLTDSSGGLALGSSSDPLSISRVVTDSSGGLALGGQNDAPIITAGSVTINDSSGGLSLGTSRDTVTTGSGVVQDTMVMPVLINAMVCLQAEELKVPDPAAEYMIRPGATFVAMPDQVADECCSGIAWVRPGPMWESDDFPSQRADASIDPAAYYAVQVELGVLRCLPTISDVPGSGDAKPTTAQWLAATQAAMDDAAAIRRAICCLRTTYGEDFVIAGQVTPLENEGNCAGMSTVVTLRVPACDCVE